MKDNRLYRIYDAGTEKMWARPYLTADDARETVKRAFTPDAFGNIMYNVLGPLHVVHLGKPVYQEDI